MPSLCTLPPELLCLVTDRLGISSLAALLQTCRGLHAFVTPALLRSAIEYDGGYTPLVHAAGTNNIALATDLVEYGADIDYLDGSLTPLHISAEAGHVEMTRFLLDRGASWETRFDLAYADYTDRHGRPLTGSISPLGFAAWKGHPRVCELFLDEMDARGLADECFADVHKFQIAANDGNTEAVRVFLKRNVNPELLGWLLRGPVSTGQAEVVDMMVEAGADVEAQPSTWRPMHSAASKGHVQVIRVLLERGAEVDPISQAKNDSPKTPLVVAARTAVVGPSAAPKNCDLDGEEWDMEVARCKEGGEEAVELLIRWGADVDMAVNFVEGMSVYQMNAELVELLERKRKAIDADQRP